MVYEGALKAPARKGLRVQIPLGALPVATSRARRLFSVMSEHEHETANAVTSAKPSVVTTVPNRGEMMVRGLLALGRPDPREVARLIAQYPGERTAIIEALHQTLGNAFVAQVLNAKPDDRASEHAPVADTTTLAVPATQRDPIDDLLAWVPAQTRGDRGTAAWLLRATELGFVMTPKRTVRELADLRDNKQQVRTGEGEPDADVEAGHRAEDKKLEKPRLDRVKKVGAGKTYEGYDVGIDESSILHTLVELVRTRITAWRANGSPNKRLALHLGDYVRGDAGFGGSPHTGGNAMDLYFLGAANGEGDVLDLLHDLPPGPRLEVFRDSNNALHLDRIGGRYGLGVPSQGEYMPPELDMERNQAAAIAAAGADHAQTIEATGIVWGSGWVQTFSAKWNGKKWVWTFVRNVGLAEQHIKSAKLHDAIADYRARSGTRASAPEKPHQQHKHHESEHR
jgi:hypothetical protein